jgi:hypothetical protein
MRKTLRQRNKRNRKTNKTKRTVSPVIGQTVKSSYITPFRIEDAQSNRSNPFISAPFRGIFNENWCKSGGEKGIITYEIEDKSILQVQYTGNLDKKLPNGKGVFTILNKDDTVTIIHSEKITTKEIEPDNKYIINKSIHFSGEGTVKYIPNQDIDKGNNKIIKDQKFSISYFPNEKSITIITKPLSIGRKLARKVDMEKQYNEFIKYRKEKEKEKFKKDTKKALREANEGTDRDILDI